MSSHGSCCPADWLIKSNDHAGLSRKAHLLSLGRKNVPSASQSANRQAFQWSAKIQRTRASDAISSSRVLGDIFSLSSGLHMAFFVSLLRVLAIGAVYRNECCGQGQSLPGGQDDIAKAEAELRLIAQCSDRVRLLQVSHFTFDASAGRNDHRAVASTHRISDGGRETISRL